MPVSTQDPGGLAVAGRLSVGQEALWLVHRLAPHAAAYNDAGAALFVPAPDPVALERAVAALVERHELLRSGFAEVDGCPVRISLPPGPAALEVRDVPGLDDAALTELAGSHAKRPFDLEHTGPLRVLLLRREADAALVVAAHHIATDAYSMHLVWRDLIEAYRAFAVGEEPQWVDLTVGYDDFVEHEQRMLSSPRRAEFAEYWRGIIAGAMPAMLPTDRPRPPRPAFQGATRSRVIPADLYDRVLATRQELRVTTFSVLFGVFQGLLYRYTNQAELLVGCPTTVRRTRPLQQVVGLLVNTILVRGSFTADTSFAAVIGAVGRQLTAAVSKCAYPYALMGTGAAGRDPLFRIAATMVAVPHDLLGPDGGARVAGCAVNRLDVPHLEAQCDLTVEFTQTPGSMTVVFRYDRELFDEPTVDTLLDRYIRLLESACADPGLPVSRAAMAGREERRRLAALGV